VVPAAVVVSATCPEGEAGADNLVRRKEKGQRRKESYLK